jgi:Domain of unknown function (DUF4185)
MSRTFALLAAAFTAVLAIPSTDAGATSPALVGSSAKVCQLTGQIDWDSNTPTAAQTDKRFGLRAVDLGFPVDSGDGPLFFLFGDARPITHPPLSPVPPDDALGVTHRRSAPDATTCVDLALVTSAPHTFAHPTVQPPILQGSFNVPSGGVFVGREFLAPLPLAPLTLPAPTAKCAETPTQNSIGRSVLARATLDDPAEFQRAPYEPPFFPYPFAGMPSGFVYASAATPPEIAPSSVILERPRGVPVFGVPRYRASIPYLAVAPAETLGDPATWSFYGGSVAGHPMWITRAQWESGRTTSGAWAPPPGAEIYAASPPGERCIGEHSVTWNAPLRSWLLLYVCGPYRVEARTAPDPWGPWSAPTVLLSLAHDPWIVCTLVMDETGCKGLTRADYWPQPAPGKTVPGVLYASFVMDRYTQDATPTGGPKQATIYWLLSTWNPYQVVVMQSTIALE